MQACGPWSSAQSRGDTPDVWPCLADPDWASYTLGVFICLSCSGIHRNIPHVSKVKSVRLDTWEDVQVEVRLAGCRGWGCPLPRRPQTQPGAEGGLPAAMVASDPAGCQGGLPTAMAGLPTVTAASDPAGCLGDLPAATAPSDPARSLARAGPYLPGALGTHIGPCCQGFMGNLHRVAEGDRSQALHLLSTHRVPGPPRPPCQLRVRRYPSQAARCTRTHRMAGSTPTPGLDRRARPH